MSASVENARSSCGTEETSLSCHCHAVIHFAVMCLIRSGKREVKVTLISAAVEVPLRRQFCSEVNGPCVPVSKITATSHIPVASQNGPEAEDCLHLQPALRLFESNHTAGAVHTRLMTCSPPRAPSAAATCKCNKRLRLLTISAILASTRHQLARLAILLSHQKLQNVRFYGQSHFQLNILKI